MIRALTTLAAFLTLAVAGQPAAQQRTEPPSQIAEQVELCVTCHGEDGRPVVEDAPIIFGQELFYLLVQLRDYASGRRENEIMTPMASDMDRETMEALAKYFSEQQWPSIQATATDEQRSIGQRVGTAGQCPQCHLGGYDGDSRNPRLAGQTPEYLESTMLAFKNRTRNNAPDKSVLLQGFSDDELAAMAHYLAAL